MQAPFRPANDIRKRVDTLLAHRLGRVALTLSHNAAVLRHDPEPEFVLLVLENLNNGLSFHLIAPFYMIEVNEKLLVSF